MLVCVQVLRFCLGWSVGLRIFAWVLLPCPVVSERELVCRGLASFSGDAPKCIGRVDVGVVMSVLLASRQCEGE